MPTINSIMDDLEEEIRNLREKCKRLDNDNAALQHQIDILKHNPAEWVDPEACKFKGMEELWVMIREVNSASIETLYGSGAFNNKICVGTIVNMYPDVRDFIKEYKAWKNGKEDKDEEKSSEEVPCSFNWKLDDTEYTIETSIPRADYDNIVKIISGKE